MDLARIDLLVLDVDGVLTAGEVTVSAEGSAERVFNTQDGCSIKLWHRLGGRTALITGRRSPSVEERARQLDIETVHQGVAGKVAAYEAVLAALDRRDEQVCCVGDDYPDLGPLGRCGFPVAVANAVPAVKQAAGFVTRRQGGRGAIAEVIELLLRKQGRWSRDLWPG